MEGWFAFACRREILMRTCNLRLFLAGRSGFDGQGNRRAACRRLKGAQLFKPCSTIYLLFIQCTIPRCAVTFLPLYVNKVASHAFWPPSAFQG